MPPVFMALLLGLIGCAVLFTTIMFVPGFGYLSVYLPDSVPHALAYLIALLQSIILAVLLFYVFFTPTPERYYFGCCQIFKFTFLICMVSLASPFVPESLKVKIQTWIDIDMKYSGFSLSSLAGAFIAAVFLDRFSTKFAYYKRLSAR